MAWERTTQFGLLKFKLRIEQEPTSENYKPFAKAVEEQDKWESVCGHRQGQGGWRGVLSVSSLEIGEGPSLICVFRRQFW